MSYDDFIASKLSLPVPTGIDPPARFRKGCLFSFQQDLVRWALRRGRAAIFANTGLGKTRMQLEWARHVCKSAGRDVLILAPLAVAAQTAAEGRAIGLDVKVCRSGGDVAPGVNITNYDRLHRFDPAAFDAVVLDESSCIKHQDAQTFKILCDAFKKARFKLACTATPAPNDWTELGTHAEFLGVCSRSEMLSEFFRHDGGETQTWRLKGHARGAFWRWVSSWGALVSHPRDLGYKVEGYDLPPLRVHEHVLKADERVAREAGLLFVAEASGLMERRQARKASLAGRVEECSRIVNADDLQWVVWCDLNAESEALASSITGAYEVTGSMTADEKESALESFAEGKVRVLVSKPSICGFGLNWQFTSRMAFVGVTDSWEAYYQAVRRCWRFGQTKPVDVHIFASEVEGSVVANLKRKEADAAELAAQLARETAGSVRAEVRGLVREHNEYNPSTPMRVPGWLKSEDAA